MTLLKKFKIDKYLVPVLIINLPVSGYSIISLPTQLGCPVACDFCISKNNKFIGNLTDVQMIELINKAKEYVITSSVVISFNGEGEAYLNATNIQSVINHFDIYNSVRNFRICTSGVKINNLDTIKGKIKPLNFQFSLHSTFDEKRRLLIPKTRELNNIISAIEKQQNLFSEIAINYVLIKDFNDTDNDFNEFNKIIPKDWLIKLNPLMESSNHDLKKSIRLDKWFKDLSNNGYVVKKFHKIGSTLQDSYEDKMTYEIDKIII